ncbi:MAG: permease [Deltaproteobacteria bacterium]|nr:permease [Deltaproteobacteria bacterium]
MWLELRLKRLKAKWQHLEDYFRSLPQSNDIERVTDFAQCKHPVLILYGFGATRRSVSILESRLRKDGFGVFSVKLGGLMDLFNTAPIDEVAKKVAQKIETLCARHNLPRFTIIGYSKGGLIGRYYVSYLGGAKRVHTLITLATPHRGSPWVVVSSLFLVGLLSKGLRQMLPASPFMRKLAKTPIPEGMYAVSISSKKDKTCPPRFSQLPSPLQSSSVYNITLPFLNHSDFVIKPSAYSEIYKHIMAGLQHAENV